MIKERLEEYFFNNTTSDLMDQVVKMLSLTDVEIELLAEEQLQVLVAHPTHNYKPEYKVEEPEDNYRPRTGKSTFHPSSYKGYRSGKSSGFTRMEIPEEFRPMKRFNSTNINLNLDCVTNRRELIQEWDNEMRLIIKTDQNLVDDYDLILTLAKAKTSGNVKDYLEAVDLSPLMVGTGEQFLTHITNVLHTTFLGTNYLTQGEEQKKKKAEDARNRLDNIRICDLCKIESYFCDYEKHLMAIPIVEWTKYIESYIRKIPFVGQEVIEDYKKADSFSQQSLAFAHDLVKRYMEKKCKNLAIKKAIKGNMCCSKFGTPEHLYGCQPKDKTIRYKQKYKKYKKKYRLRKPKNWSYPKSRKYHGKRVFKRRYQKKDLEETQAEKSPSDKKKFCPQGKETCRCWICNEIGHFAKDCKNKTNNYSKILEVLQEQELEPVFDLEELKEQEQIWEIESYYSSSSDDESDSSEDSQ